MVQKYYSIMTKNGTNIVNNLLYEDAETLFTNGWNISLGTGNLEPTSDTTELINPILDKNSEDYPDITFGKHEIYGHYAEITIPESIKGHILTECGLFNNEGVLIAISKIHLDLRETMLDNGIELTAKQRIYIQAVPAATNIIYTPQGDLINKELLDLELKNYQKINEKSVENGYCELDENAKVPLVNIPSSLTNVDLSNLSATGEAKFDAKVDVDLTNVNQTGKNNIMAWGMPDFSNSTVLNQNVWTVVNTDSYIYAGAVSTTTIYGIYIKDENGNLVRGAFSDDGYNGCVARLQHTYGCVIQSFVPKGYAVNVNGGDSAQQAVLCPLKGVN